MFSTHTLAHTPDHEMVRQKRLQKFLLNCAKSGVPVMLDSSKQSNATFDTMLEVAEECDKIGIPSSDKPVATHFSFPLPPTPRTGSRKSVWQVEWSEGPTPSIPEDDGTLSSKEFPDFDSVFAGKVHRGKKS